MMETLFDCDSLSQKDIECITGLVDLAPTRSPKLIFFSTPYSKDNYFERLYNEWRRKQETDPRRTG